VSRRSRKLPQDPVAASIESLSHEGRGIAHVNGKTVFIDRALPGEEVMFRYDRIKASFDEGHAVEIIQSSDSRTEPQCRHFGMCGGCSLQHMQAGDQIRMKEKVLLEQLQHIGKVVPEQILEPLTGPVWGYRRKARLGVKYVIKKGKVLIGFREKRGRYLADLESCEVLHPHIGKRLTELQALIGNLDIYDQIPQLEVAIGRSSTALVFRHMQALGQGDEEKLAQFQAASGCSIYLQPAGPDSVVPLNGSTDTALDYRLEKYDLDIHFKPLDFTQVNFDINESMLDRVMDLLEPQSSDTILDLFCGLGNFTLPLATRAGRVTGVEGSRDLVERARQNAQANGIQNAELYAFDLMQEDLKANFLDKKYNKILLDPPRTGAKEILTHLDLKAVEKIVYVSCNPATLARDAGILVNEKGFRLIQGGVMDMFPHTSHVESIACFGR